MLKNLIRCLFYSLLDILRIIKNLISRNTFIILSPRILSLILKKVLIFDKKNKFFFTIMLETIVIF